MGASWEVRVLADCPGRVANRTIAGSLVFLNFVSITGYLPTEPSEDTWGAGEYYTATGAYTCTSRWVRLKLVNQTPEARAPWGDLSVLLQKASDAAATITKLAHAECPVESAWSKESMDATQKCLHVVDSVTEQLLEYGFRRSDHLEDAMQVYI